MGDRRQQLGSSRIYVYGARWSPELDGFIELLDKNGTPVMIVEPGHFWAGDSDEFNLKLLGPMPGPRVRAVR